MTEGWSSVWRSVRHDIIVLSACNPLYTKPTKSWLGTHPPPYTPAYFFVVAVEKKFKISLHCHYRHRLLVKITWGQATRTHGSESAMFVFMISLFNSNNISPCDTLCRSHRVTIYNVPHWSVTPGWLNDWLWSPCCSFSVHFGIRADFVWSATGRFWIVDGLGICTKRLGLVVPRRCCWEAVYL